MTPDLVSDFAAVAKPKWLGYRLKTVMRTFDPVKFRKRALGAGPRADVDRGNGSEFLLANVYLNRYEPTALRTRRPNTKRLYKTTLRTFDKFLKRSATLDDLSDDTVSKYAVWRARRVGKGSINKDLFNLLALWRWCNRKGLVDNWPDVQLEKPPRRVPVAWTEAEIRKLYQTMATLPGRVGKHRASYWWTALLLIAWDSGERISAIMACSLGTGLICKPDGYVSEQRAQRRFRGYAVRLSVDAIQALKKIHGDSDAVFPWPFCFTYLWRELSRIQRQAGLPTDAKSKFHRIRRSVASHAEAAGGNATAMLRHSKREITESYIDPKIVKRQQPADVLFRLAQ